MIRIVLLAIIYGAIPIAFITATAIAMVRISNFLKSHPNITTRKDLTDFKSLAKFDMYLAFGILSLTGVGALLVVGGLTTGFLKSSDLIALAIVGPCIAVFGFLVQRLESKAKQLEIKNPALEDEFDEVVATWMDKMFPDW